MKTIVDALLKKGFIERAKAPSSLFYEIDKVGCTHYFSCHKKYGAYEIEYAIFLQGIGSRKGYMYKSCREVVKLIESLSV